MCLILSEVLRGHGLDRPDGRALHRYACSSESHAALAQLIRSRLASAHLQVLDELSAAFVLWASEYTRARYEGGQLTWVWVLDAISPRLDGTPVRELVERGLRWWKRTVRVSEGGRRMWLYSLLAEGGLPDPVLRQANRYQRVVHGLLSAIERAGLADADELPDTMLAKAVSDLPQALRYDDIARLLGDLALAIARLRARIPADVPSDALDRWLDTKCPGWMDELPLRLSAETAEMLIRSTVRTERARGELLPMGSRLLCRDAGGRWHGYARLSEHSRLDAIRLPEHAHGRRMRLLPAGGNTLTAPSLVFTATPEQDGWSIHRFGARGAALVSLDPSSPLVLAAYSDGHLLGEIETLPALATPDEEPSFWVAIGKDESGEAHELELLLTEGRTRADRMAVLVGRDVVPQGDSGLVVGEACDAPDGTLWWVRGSGQLELGSRRYAIRTGDEVAETQAQLFAAGDVLQGWRVAASGGLIFRGRPALYGSFGDARATLLRPSEQRWADARALLAQRAEWLVAGAIRARLRAFVMPRTTTLVLREIAEDSVSLEVCGLPLGLRIELSAAGTVVRATVDASTVNLILKVPGRPPGQITLRLLDVASFRDVTLGAAWPARRGLILTPTDDRLAENAHVAVQDLVGWRVVVPDHSRGDLELALRDHRIGLGRTGETSLSAFVPYVRALLANAGPDGEIRMSLVVNGHQGHRIAVRRYGDVAQISDRHLVVGRARDIPAHGVAEPGRLQAHAVDIGTGGTADRRAAVQMIDADVPGSIDLREHLPEVGGPWLIQSRYDGRTQRPVVWPRTPSIRTMRIDGYAEQWHQLLYTPSDPMWEELAWLMRAAAGGGDMGCLDQVQALARVPAAAVTLLLRAAREELNEMAALELAAPLVWAAIPVGEFRHALDTDRRWRTSTYSDLFTPAESANHAQHAQFRAVGNILQVRPDLRGHFAVAFDELGVRPAVKINPVSGMAESLGERDPLSRLVAAAQAAARRFDELPTGLPRGTPLLRRPAVLSFGDHVQPLIDGVLEVAEHAAGIRPAADEDSLCRYLTLRQVDPVYFDDALPFAIMYTRMSR